MLHPMPYQRAALAAGIISSPMAEMINLRAIMRSARWLLPPRQTLLADTRAWLRSLPRPNLPE